jgi:hypothetical protein
MSQVFFDGDTTPGSADLDANFAELYALLAKLPYANSYLGWLAAPVLATDGTFKGIQLTGGPAWQAGGVATAIFSVNMGGSVASPTFLSGPTVGSTRYTMSGSLHLWLYAPAGGNAGDPITYTEAMRLSNGSLMVGTSTTSVASGGVVINFPTGGISAITTGHASGTSSGAVYQAFAYGASTIGSITQNGTTGVTYSTNSDYRLKTNVQPITASASGAFIDALSPVTFEWIETSLPSAGFIAHELQAVSPTSVVGSKDATQPVGNLVDGDAAIVAQGVPQPAQLDDGMTWSQTGVQPVYQGIDAGSPEIIAMLVAEVKSLRARLAAAGIA